MFNDILNDYEKNKKILEVEQEQLKKQMKILTEPLSKKILHGVNSNITILHSNQQIIEKESKQLKQEVQKFHKEVNNWQNMYDQLNESLKELGDVVNWSQMIEKDLEKLLQEE